MPVAVEQGGKRLDAFNTFLPTLYSRMGFKAVAKLPFNREYAPDGWSYDFYNKEFPQTRGEPEVVFMVYDPENASSETDVLIDDYDVGTLLQRESLSVKDSSTELSEDEDISQEFEDLLSGEEKTNETKFSVAPTNPNKLVNRIVKGKPTPVYGSILDRGKPIPVVLPAGRHLRTERRDGTLLERGQGLYHIQQRRHD